MPAVCELESFTNPVIFSIKNVLVMRRIRIDDFSRNKENQQICTGCCGVTHVGVVNSMLQKMTWQQTMGVAAAAMANGLGSSSLYCMGHTTSDA